MLLRNKKFTQSPVHAVILKQDSRKAWTFQTMQYPLVDDTKETCARELSWNLERDRLLYNELANSPDWKNIIIIVKKLN